MATDGSLLCSRYLPLAAGLIQMIPVQHPALCFFNVKFN